MLRSFTCIMCPQGCEITAEGSLEGEIREEALSISGNKCPKGKAYVVQELTNPMRNIASSVLVEGGDLPIASVRLNAMIPKARIFDVMEEIRRVRMVAPVKEGQIVIENVLGQGADVIITKDVLRVE